MIAGLTYNKILRSISSIKGLSMPRIVQGILILNYSPFSLKNNAKILEFNKELIPVKGIVVKITMHDVSKFFLNSNSKKYHSK